MGMPSGGWYPDAAAARRRHRRRRHRLQMMSVFAVGTVAVLLVTAWLVVKLDKMGKTPVAQNAAAVSSPTPTAAHASAASPPASPRAFVTDASSGLSYELLPSPWRYGCPPPLNTGMFSWSGGESAVAGRIVLYGTRTDWYGNACSGQVPQQFRYGTSTSHLERAAMGLADALDQAYYSGLEHSRALEESSAMRVSGHRAWAVEFLMTYPGAASQGLSWTSELAAVVVVSRASGEVPAVFYVSVPSNLGTFDVGALISSLRLS